MHMRLVLVRTRDPYLCRYSCRIRKDLKTVFEVRKLSRRGSMERGEADLARVLPMNSIGGFIEDLCF